MWLAVLIIAAVLTGSDQRGLATEKGLGETVDFSHDISLEAAVSTHDGNSQKLEGIIESGADVDVSPRIDVTGLLRLRGDALDRLEPGELNDATTSSYSRRIALGHQGELELRELYADTRLNWGRLRVGKQQVVWGVADRLRVLDVVNPHDFREFILDDFVDSRIPLWSANLEVPVDWGGKGDDPFQAGSGTFQWIWIPDTTYHRLPPSDAAYAFTSPLFVPRLPVGMATRIRSPKKPDRFFADSDVGMRFSTLWRGWDLSVNYLYHHNDVPAFFREVEVVSGRPTAIVTPGYVRSHLVGGRLSNAIGDLTVRGEVGAFLDRPFSTGDMTDRDGVVMLPDFNYVIGLDWHGIEETVVSMQFFQSWVPEKAELYRRELESNVTFLVRRELFYDTWIVELEWLTSLERGDGLIRPKLAYEWSDQLRSSVGIDLFYGDNNGLFGQFERNDRIVLGIEWQF